MSNFRIRSFANTCPYCKREFAEDYLKNYRYVDGKIIQFCSQACVSLAGNRDANSPKIETSDAQSGESTDEFVSSDKQPGVCFCEVCNLHIVVPDIWSITTAGQAYQFCSENCQKKFYESGKDDPILKSARRQEENPVSWALRPLKKYAVFRGRASRSEFWYFTIFMLVIRLAAGFLDVKIGTYSEYIGIGAFGATIGVAAFLPYLAVSVRRLHDTGRSGWWLLLTLIPLLGNLVILFFMISRGDSQGNQYDLP